MNPIQWSQSFIPKVFGGILGVVWVMDVAQAGDVAGAIHAVKQAAYVASGVKDEMNRVKSRYTNELVSYLKKGDIHNEVFILGAIAKTARDKKIDFVYKGNEFSVAPNSMTVRIPF